METCGFVLNESLPGVCFQFLRNQFVVTCLATYILLSCSVLNPVKFKGFVVQLGGYKLLCLLFVHITSRFIHCYYF